MYEMTLFRMCRSSSLTLLRCSDGKLQKLQIMTMSYTRITRDGKKEAHTRIAINYRKHVKLQAIGDIHWNVQQIQYFK